MAKVTSVQNYIDTIEDRFVPAASRGVTFTVQYALSEPDRHEFYVDIDDGTMASTLGRHPSPDVTIASTGEDFVALVNGSLGGKRAFFSGRLKFTGEVSKAMKLEKIFPKG